jgi:hypothetical protein
MNTHKWFVASWLALSPLVQAAQATADARQTMRPQMTFHGISERLDVLARHPIPVAPGNGFFEFEKEDQASAPEPSLSPWLLPQSFVQTITPTPSAAIAGASFEGPGVGLVGFNLTGAPPDPTLAVGPNHIVAWVNSMYTVFNKSGAVLLAPTNGNDLFVGLPNLCATTNRGDPIVLYDRLADRWIFSQWSFAITGGAASAPYFQCFAISTSGDPLGTYARYAVQFGSVAPGGLHDVAKLGIWPDAYYTSYNVFAGSPAGGLSGAALCASDRNKMLAGDSTATTLCAPINFYGGGAAFLPADQDGTTLPSDLTQGGIFMRFSPVPMPALRIIKLKPNFAAGTVTLNDGFGGALGTFVDLALPATASSCGNFGGNCIAQPGTANLLQSVGSQLMYRLAFRNRAGVESIVATQSVDPDGAGARNAALRWYEIRNPLGNPADPVSANRPTIFQNGTYDPGASGDRWMGSIAMDGAGNILLGYSVVNAVTGLFPSIGIAGRELNDPLNTLQAEILAFPGGGSQTGSLTRWGDYTTMQIDPSDDRTFWYINQFLGASGTFNWRTRIVSYKFPSDSMFANGFE